MANVTHSLRDFKRPLNKGPGYSFCYQSISCRLSIVTFALGRIV